MPNRGEPQSADHDDHFAANKVDLVSLDATGTVVRLHIVVDIPWTGSDGQVQSLQEKLHNYVGFALDGQLVATYPETEGLPWSIIVDCQTGDPDERSREVIAAVVPAIESYGGRVLFQTDA